MLHNTSLLATPASLGSAKRSVSEYRGRSIASYTTQASSPRSTSPFSNQNFNANLNRRRSSAASNRRPSIGAQKVAPLIAPAAFEKFERAVSAPLYAEANKQLQLQQQQQQQQAQLNNDVVADNLVTGEAELLKKLDNLVLAAPDQQNASIITNDVVESDDELERGEQHVLSKVWNVWEKDYVDNFCSESETETESEDTYSKCCKVVKSFETIEEFMQLYNGVPLPSSIINKHHMVRRSNNNEAPESPKSSAESEGSSPTASPRPQRQRRNSILGAIPMKQDDKNAQRIDAVMFFEDGVAPTWEDPAHQNGGLFQFTFKTDFSGRALDEIWERVLFSIIGGALQNSEYITGIRMADRLPSNMPDHVLNTYANNQNGQATSAALASAMAVRLEIWHRELPNKDDINELRKNCLNLMKEPLSCGGSAKAGRTVRKGDATTKTPFVYEPRALETSELSMAQLEAACRRGSV